MLVVSNIGFEWVYVKMCVLFWCVRLYVFGFFYCCYYWVFVVCGYCDWVFVDVGGVVWLVGVVFVDVEFVVVGCECYFVGVVCLIVIGVGDFVW